MTAFCRRVDRISVETPDSFLLTYLGKISTIESCGKQRRLCKGCRRFRNIIIQTE